MVFLSVFLSVVFVSLAAGQILDARTRRARLATRIKNTPVKNISLAALVAAGLATGGAFFWDSQNSVSAQSTEDENFEIIKSTDSRVWRLNKKTGEVSVCTLTGDQLVCTDSENAATPPKKTYEDIQKDADAEQEKREADARAEQERQLTILDRFLDMIRELIHMSMGETTTAKE